MQISDLSENITPEVGDAFVNIPITIDAKFGRGDRFKGQMVANGVTVFITIFLFWITIKNGEIGVLSKIGRLILFFIVSTLIIRFVIMRENKINKLYKRLEDKDYVLKIAKMWGIYGQSEAHPQIFYTRNGKLVSFIRMNKDVTVGKQEIDLYNHFEAISDALNIGGKSELKISHIDYMDSVGNDDRIQEWYEEVVETKNPDFKEAYSMIFNHLEESVSSHMSFEDVYAVSSADTEALFLYKVTQFAKELKNGNYTSYKILNKEDLQELFCKLYNVHEFSFMEASSMVFNKEALGNIFPIEIQRGTEVEKLGMTQAEKREKQAKEQELKAQKKKKGKKNKKKSKESVEVNEQIDKDNLDIF